jgi:RNA polymerase sigma-70 factor, ECF subfamily
VAEDAAAAMRATVEAVWRAESRRVLATLIRLLGDFDRAEEAVSEAFAAALERWPAEGVPASPRAWLVSAGRFRAIDAMRRRMRFDAALGQIAERLAKDEPEDDEDVADDTLRLVFTCCHPVLAPEAQAALTLREICGLTTEEIARAFLAPAPTIAQRIVRAKARLRDEAVAYEVPPAAELPARLDAVLRVVYLVFNEGYSAASGASLVRTDLSSEAIRLARLLVELMPEPEAQGLLALVLLLDARRGARVSEEGDFVPLDEQDRALWDRRLIAEGAALVETALRSRRFGPYTLQAAIAAVHAESASAAATDWRQIVGLYDLLLRAAPSPVVELNRAVAVGMCGRPDDGVALIDAILARGDLAAYLPAHAARADLCRRAGRLADASASYAAALALARQDPERRFLARRLAGCAGRT